MSTNIQYHRSYEKHGEVAPEHILDNDIWIDIGNDLREGVFDHHQTEGSESAFGAVVHHGEFLASARSYVETCLAEGSVPEIFFHVHMIPDLDCLAGMYIITKMFERGAEGPAKAMQPETLDRLLDFVERIDSGRNKSLSTLTLYAYIVNIGQDIPNELERSECIFEEAMKVLELTEKALDQDTAGGIDLFTMPLEQYVDVSALGRYSETAESLQKETEAYQRDKKNNIVIFRKMEVWNQAKAQIDSVKTAVWQQMPSGRHGYIFAREADECMMTVSPKQIQAEGNEEAVTRVVISLNPDLPGSEELTLMPMAEILEQCEQIEEEEIFRLQGIYRRDHSHARDSISHFARQPFGKTNDPWYVSDRGDIIDAPRIGSLLKYSEILSMLENASPMVKRVGVVRFYAREGEVVPVQEENSAEISLGSLYQWAEQAVNELESSEDQLHLLVRIAVDRDMLRHHNRLLAACCLNMVGKSDSAISRNNILEIDYRTCLYTDQAITILVAVDTEKHPLVRLTGEEDMVNSRICADLKNLLEHRQELRDIGTGLSEKIQSISKNTTEIDRFNTRLVQLSARIQNDDLVTDPLEQMIFSFIRNSMRIDNLKNSVITSAELLVKNAEQQRDRELKKAREKQETLRQFDEEAAQQRDARIQAGIGWVTVLAVFSAWIDAYDFIGKLSPDMEDGWQVLMQHPWLFLLEASMALAILVVGVIAIVYVTKAWQDAYKGN